MLYRLFAYACIVSSLVSSGWAKSSYKGPRLLTWNVTIDSAPPGAEILWTTGSYDEGRPLGKAPVTASIPLPISENGFFNAVRIYATVGRAHSAVSTTELLYGRWSHDTLHSTQDLAKLPSRLTINAYQAHEFEVFGRGMMPEYEKNPELWSRYVTSLRGKVLSIQESERGCVVQLLVDDDSGGPGNKLMVIYWSGQSMRGVVEGTYLKVLGNVLGRVSGTNGFGGTVTALTFNAYGYVADWMLTTATQNYLESKKDLFSKWAEGSLFAGEGQVTVQ